MDTEDKPNGCLSVHLNSNDANRSLNRNRKFGSPARIVTRGVEITGRLKAGAHNTNDVFRLRYRAASAVTTNGRDRTGTGQLRKFGFKADH